MLTPKILSHWGSEGHRWYFIHQNCWIPWGEQLGFSSHQLVGDGWRVLDGGKGPWALCQDGSRSSADEIAPLPNPPKSPVCQTQWWVKRDRGLCHGNYKFYPLHLQFPAPPFPQVVDWQFCWGQIFAHSQWQSMVWQRKGFETFLWIKRGYSGVSSVKTKKGWQVSVSDEKCWV